MKTKLRLKIIWESTVTKVALIVTIVFVLMLAIILPSILNARPKGSVIAFNRDVTSGTREAFVEKVLEQDPDEFSPGKNVLEASNNESMIKATLKNEYSTGYVSFGTVAEFDETGKAVLKDGIDSSKLSFATLNSVSPDKANIIDGTYSGQRNFNMFLRVENESPDYAITTYDFENNTMIDDVSSLDDSLKASALFYNWIIYSQEALEVFENGYPELDIDPSGELPITTDRYVMDEDYLNTYIKNTQITDDHIRIEVVGSSSASAVMEELSEVFEHEVNSIYSDSLEFVIATNGSGDAFKKSIPGVENSYIGMQSREAKDEELSNWGYDSVDDLTYHPFAIDAILVIYNNEHLSNEDKQTSYNVTSEDLNNLYQSNEIVMWEDLFTKGGGS